MTDDQSGPVTSPRPAGGTGARGERGAGGRDAGGERGAGGRDAGGRDAGGPAVSAVRRVPLINVANALTVLRLAMVPVFVAATVLSGMVHPGWRLAAALIFVVASVTDFVDGWIARTYGLVTSFGKVADPIADKVLTGSALLLLSGYGRLPWWVTGVILAREIGVTALRFWVIRLGVIPASRGGKAKTVLQIAAISWYLLPFPPAWAVAGPWLMGAAVLVTVITGVDYALRAVRLRRAAVRDG